VVLLDVQCELFWCPFIIIRSWIINGVKQVFEIIKGMDAIIFFVDQNSLALKQVETTQMHTY
jgi:hypothetical protein